jgi:hypothetical protein
MRHALLLLLALSVAIGGAGALRAASPKTLVYSGAVKDSKGSPVAGIFWFRFGLHKDKADPKMLWSEEMYVAVDRGSYQVELGKERPIPQAIELSELFLSIHIDGVEVERQQVTADMVSGGAGTPAIPGASGLSSAGCAECLKAERAGDCERLGGMSFKQLSETIAQKQISVGTTAHFTSAVGSGEGTPFRLTCPPGFVVTGLKGKADDKISNLQLVCSPLEAQ